MRSTSRSGVRILLKNAASCSMHHVVMRGRAPCPCRSICKSAPKPDCPRATSRQSARLRMNSKQTQRRTLQRIERSARTPSRQESTMQTNTARTTVSDFLAQKRIAVAGVSHVNSKHPAANLIYRRLKTTGHDVFAVNPHMKSFDGDLCYPDLRSIPEGVDGVVIVTRPETTEQIVHDCHNAGVPRVWMHQSIANGSSVSK